MDRTGSGSTMAPAARDDKVLAGFDAASIPRTIRPVMFRHIPNALTGLRLVLAFVFFSMLAWYQYEGRGNWLLKLGFFFYVIALIPDFLDGYLARRWHVEGAFGRIVDPFVDKILVLGTF